MSCGYHFTEHEELLLEIVFKYNQRPNKAKIEELAEKLAVSENNVYRWFVRKRWESRIETTQAKGLHRKFCSPYTCT